MPSHPSDTLSLVADIGGTNTRVALADGYRVLPDTVRRYSNADHAGLETVLRKFIKEEGGVDCIAACVAVAGPVRDGRATLTNLDWTMDKETIGRATNAETVAILNDLQAQGHALGHLEDSTIKSILRGPEGGPNAAKLVIGIGTGFNAAPVYDTEEGRVVPPAEAGHANLPIRDENELRLCNYVASAHGFPAVEDVVSGRGLERVYAWLGHEDGDPREASSKDIMDACANGSDPRATRAAEVFAHIFGTVAGNLALIYLPFGGIYLVGGMARAFGPYLDKFGFCDAFRDKGRFAGFMKNFAVHLIEDDYAALTGSASHLMALRSGTLDKSPD